VQWDQRGAGRSFARNGAAGVTLETLIADGIDLAEQLHKRFPRAPLILFGHSWGTIIASGMALQRPDLFVAYVGTGQVAAWADTVQFQFDFLKQRYTEKATRPRSPLSRPSADRTQKTPVSTSAFRARSART
jgi:pimeloyl-ACP methyl ester carboxylesterase